MTTLERLRMFGSPIPKGLAVRVVDAGTKLGVEVVNDSNTVQKGSELFMTQKTFDEIRKNCKTII
ncbi:hypothetical protein [Acinetobacter soli]|uniref:hypothetical protein n=1 Tax=Acinetobacter soli TaxID=487316 RepID=UPI00125011BE|nr:hypothetical protein [Acinetobacter soli]